MLHHSARFRKQWKRLSKKVRDEAASRLEILQVNEFDTFLNNHKMSGKYAEYRSINVTPDIRIMYQRAFDDFFLAGIGTHSELYK